MRVHRLSRVGMNLQRVSLHVPAARNDPSQLLLHGRIRARLGGKGARDRVALIHEAAVLAVKKTAGATVAVAGAVSRPGKKIFRVS
jgi:hypothetical protein